MHSISQIFASKKWILFTFTAFLIIGGNVFLIEQDSAYSEEYHALDGVTIAQVGCPPFCFPPPPPPPPPVDPCSLIQCPWPGPPGYSSNYSSNYTVDYPGNYDPDYSPFYAPNYAADYDPDYSPFYAPNYAADYDPDYSPFYAPNYAADYDPDYSPFYAPNYAADYDPDYSPFYAPNYAADYDPDYSPFYAPNYAADYDPDYSPFYAPNYAADYDPDYSPFYAPNYAADYDPDYSPFYAPNYAADYDPDYSPFYAPNYAADYTSFYSPDYTPVYPSCTWQDTGTTRDNKTCANTSTARIQKQKEQKCGPSNCTGRCSGNKNKDSKRWINSGSPITQTCIGNCTNGECPTPPECRWQDTGTTKNICQNKTTTKQQTQEQCGPTDCINGSCTKGEYRWIDSTPQQTTICTNGKICKIGACTGCTSNTDCPQSQVCQSSKCVSPPPTCIWKNTGTPTTSCSLDKRNILKNQEQTCGPVGCSGGVCTQGTTRTHTTTTNTCTHPQECDASSGTCKTPNKNKPCVKVTTKSCFNKTTLSTKVICDPYGCYGNCTAGTTTTTCPEGQVCKRPSGGRAECTSCTTNTDCPTGQACTSGTCKDPTPECIWQQTTTTQSICKSQTQTQQQTQYRCGPNNCTGTTNCTKGTTEWRDTGTSTTCTNNQVCTNGSCINPTCDWITTTTTQQDKTCSNTTTLSTQTQTKQVCGPTNCQGTTNCTKGEEQWINTGTPTTTDCSITNQTCNNGDCITPTCTETTQTTHTCQDTDTILTTIETTCTPQGCTGGSCTPTTQTSTTDCQNNQLCHNGQCLPQCNWTDTGTTRTNNTCTTTTTQTTQQQKEQECGPNNCIGRCTTNKAQGTTQWIDIGTTTTITCPQGQACTTTTCAPLCTWIDNTVSLCLGARTAYLNVSQKCGPDNCQGGVCRKGANRGAGGKIVQCPNGCSNDQCIELCTWEPDTQDTCSDKTTILHTTTNTCGPDNCQRGICTKGTTQIPTTTTTTCPTGQVCKVIGGVGTCTRCTTNTDCPTNQTCTSGICTTPPECIWEDTGTKRIKAGVCATTTAQQEEKEQECGPNNCIGGTCTKGDTQWIDSTIKACIITGQTCTSGICGFPQCRWQDTTNAQNPKRTCDTNDNTNVVSQPQKEQVCGPTNCAGTCPTNKPKGTKQIIPDTTKLPTTTTCPTNQECDTGVCKPTITCTWTPEEKARVCDTNNIRQITIQHQERCGPLNCTGDCTGKLPGSTRDLPDTQAPDCTNNQVCHNGSCITPQPPTLQNNRLDTSITHKETSCRTEQRFTWTPLFNNGATQKTYHLQVATERRFFREYDNARNANQRKTAQDKLTVNFKPRTASSTVRSIPIFTTQQNNKLLFNEITNRGRYNSGHNRTYYARVKVYDTHNQESQWSTIQSFTTPDYPGPKTTIQVPSFVPLGRTFTTTGIIESQHTQKSNLSYEWNIQKNDTSTDVTHNVIQLPITDPPTTIDQEKTKESIQLSLPQETEYTITLTTIDNSLSSHNNTCTTQEDITPGNNQQQFPTYREVPATVE